MRNRTPTRLAALATSVLLCLSVAPQGMAQDQPDPLLPEGSGYSDENLVTIRLSLDDAVAIGIEHNLQVEVERFAPLIATEDVAVAWGVYDPVLSGDYTYTDFEGIRTSLLTAQDPVSTNHGGGASVSSLLPYIGASIFLDYTGERNETNSPIDTLSPKYDSGFTVSGKVPLLRGLIWNEPWTNVKVSDTILGGELEGFRGALMDTVLFIESTYWNLIAQKEQLGVAQKSLETSQSLLDQTRTQYDVGVVSKVDVIESEAGVAARELEVIRADARLRQAQDNIIDLVYGTLLQADSRINLVATNDLSDYTVTEVDPNRAVALAFKNRPELARLEEGIRGREIELKFAKNQRLPQLDASASYGTNGVRGTLNPDCIDFGTGGSCPVIPGLSGGFRPTHDDWYKNDGGKNVTAMVTFSVPIGNYGPRHGVSRAKLELRRAETLTTQLEQRIIVEVRDDIRLQRSALQGIHAAGRQVAAATEQLRAERIRLEHGESTPFDVLQREEQLVAAQFEEINALQIYRTSQSELNRSQGTILEAHNIRVGDQRSLRMGEYRSERSGWSVFTPWRNSSPDDDE